ncbi:hypothetical protein OW731_03250, partial [Avibacterium paragallinarum]
TLNVNAGYTVAKYDNSERVASNANATGLQNKSWRLATQLGFGDAKFGVEYGQTHIKHKDANISAKSSLSFSCIGVSSATRIKSVCTMAT